MTNREFYREQILDIACSGDTIAFDKTTNTLGGCYSIRCADCLFKDASNCVTKTKEWCDSEYIEPCPFEEGELVEVSNDGIDWRIRYFSHFVSANETYKYAAFQGGLKCSKDATNWKYCRKYGTLGGLVEEKI